MFRRFHKSAAHSLKIEFRFAAPVHASICSATPYCLLRVFYVLGVLRNGMETIHNLRKITWYLWEWLRSESGLLVGACATWS